MKLKSLLPVIALITLLALSSGVYLSSKKKPPINPTIAFLTETFDLIQTNYWDKLEDQDLIELYLASARKFANAPQLVKADSKEELFKQLEAVVSQDNIPIIVDAVLQNLQPLGRSRLYTQKLTQDLANNVSNIDPNADRYQSLGLDQSATQKDIETAYQAKTATASAQEKPALETAYNTLKDQTTREIYNQTGADPTMPHQKLTNSIYYIGIKKFSPTTLAELTSIAQKTDQYPELNTLIFDLSDNVGGAIDGLPYFLGPFIGPDQYAYQFLQQNNKQDFKTKSSWLDSFIKFKRVIILINGQAQSSAEVMASVLKKYHVGVLVGTTTRGWGTVESVFNLENQLADTEKYSIFLVHHLTLREDGQPIEGNGVEPDINVQVSDWQQQLSVYYNDQELINQVNSLIQPLLLHHSGS